MPIFALICPECNHEWDALMKSRDELHEEECPECGNAEPALKLTSHGYYKINGNNSASVTPKKFRGER